MAAGESEVVVVGDARGEREQSDADPDAQVVQGAGAVALEPEYAFGGVDDRFDGLADAGDDRRLAGLVFSVRTHDRGAELGGGGFELRAGVALVGDDGLAAVQAAGEQSDRDLALATLRRPQGRGAWCPVGALSRCRRIP